MRLLVVRHGQSTWNADARWQGQADPPLSELGERQAEAAAQRLAQSHAVRSAWTSDLVRARRTTEIIADRLRIPLRVDRRLRERHAGDWTGLTRAEIEERYPGDLAARRSPPGFERDEALLERALPVLLHIASQEALREASMESAEEAGDVLVVTHGGIVRTVERHLGAPAEPVPNLGGRWIEVEADRLSLGDRLLLIDPDDVAVTVPRSI